MEKLLAVAILLGFFFLFGWRGLIFLGRLLAFVGAGIIILFAFSIIGLDPFEKNTWGFLGVIFLIGLLLTLLLRSKPSEEDLKKREEIYNMAREQLLKEREGKTK